MTDTTLLLAQGQVIEAILNFYTEPMGFWFFILMYAGVIMMIYMKTESATIPLVVSLFASGVMLATAPAGSQGVSEIMTVSLSLFAASAGGILYKIYRGR
jgi:hypothetical protein